METNVDWNKVMEIAHRVAELDLYVTVSARLGTVPRDMGHADGKKVVLLQVTTSSPFERGLKGISSVYLDPETHNFLFAAGMAMSVEDLVSSDYNQALNWLGLK